MLPDELHPSAEGYKVLAQNFQRHVAEIVFPPAKRKIDP